MNEMNNGDNEFNSQNNINHQNQQMNYVPNTEHQNVSNNSYQQPPKKSYCGLLVIFMLISLGLAGYIVYDKAIKKEEQNKPEIEENIPVNENNSYEDGNEDKPTEESQTRNYFSTETIIKKLNNENLTVNLKFWLSEVEAIEQDGELVYNPDDAKYTINCDLFFNDKLIKEIGSYSIYDSKNMTETEAIDKAQKSESYNEYVNWLKDIGVINGDKEYLYVKNRFYGVQGDDSDILVFNTLGEEIISKEIETSGRGIHLDSSCYGYSSFVDTYNKDYKMNGNRASRYFISSNGLIYAEEDGSCGNGIATIYEISFTNNKAVSKEISKCSFEAEGAC